MWSRAGSLHLTRDLFPRVIGGAGGQRSGSRDTLQSLLHHRPAADFDAERYSRYEDSRDHGGKYAIVLRRPRTGRMAGFTMAEPSWLCKTFDVLPFSSWASPLFLLILNSIVL